jgi:hypothetical protein
MRLPDATNEQVEAVFLPGATAARDRLGKQYIEEQVIADWVVELGVARPVLTRLILVSVQANLLAGYTPAQATICACMTMLQVCDRIYADREGARLIGETL